METIKLIISAQNYINTRLGTHKFSIWKTDGCSEFAVEVDSKLYMELNEDEIELVFMTMLSEESSNEYKYEYRSYEIFDEPMVLSSYRFYEIVSQSCVVLE